MALDLVSRNAAGGIRNCTLAFGQAHRLRPASSGNARDDSGFYPGLPVLSGDHEEQG